MPSAPFAIKRQGLLKYYTRKVLHASGFGSKTCYLVREQYGTYNKMRKIVNTLTKTCGADNFHYVAHQEPFENEEEDKLEFKA